MHISKIISDIVEYRNSHITFIPTEITHLYRRKYICCVRVGSVDYKCKDKNDYEKVMKDVKDYITGNKSVNLYCIIHAAKNEKSVDKIIEQHSTKDQYGVNIPVKTFNRAPPVGSSKFRVKLTFKCHFRDKEIINKLTNNIKILEDSYGTDNKEDSYIMTNGVPLYSYSSTYVYVNFKDEDDVAFIQPFTNMDLLHTVQLEVYDG